eukprot:CAMPEP_0173172314 /NCGR_PEP_ID=MMETSP1141-20130122/2242_1 /TAXON_ID=483371 /ORGANISM="non described non described, Strain CCMP2298" /LENGTH=150 /DNA_ID=CAMNT_0014094341 /DNA_START=866 /DNA_END=1317 /DNA_ORIENTATION=+
MSTKMRCNNNTSVVGVVGGAVGASVGVGVGELAAEECGEAVVFDEVEVVEGEAGDDGGEVFEGGAAGYIGVLRVGAGGDAGVHVDRQVGDVVGPGGGEGGTCVGVVGAVVEEGMDGGEIHGLLGTQGGPVRGGHQLGEGDALQRGAEGQP